MIRPRTRKVISDLWNNKIRTLLVIASIAVGLFAVGVIATLNAVILDDMRAGYAAVNPANLQFTLDDFDQNLVDQVRKVEGVQDAEGVRTASLRLEASPGEWIAISIQAIPDIDQMAINQVHLEEGKWPPDKREIVIDRFKLKDTNAKLGDFVTIEMPDGKTRQMRLVGEVHDQTIGASGQGGGGYFLAPVQGYITTDTLEWLGLPDTFNRLYATVEGDKGNLAAIGQVSARVRDKVESNGNQVFSAYEASAYDHPNSLYIEAISGVLLLLGLLVVFLSGFLITNTMSALLNQQTEQIGILKTLGARRFQVIALYILLIFVFGILAFAIALPLSYQVAFWLLDFLSREVSFTFRGYRFVPSAVILQLLIALLVPQIAGFLPILRASGVSVREAIRGESIGGKRSGGGARQTFLQSLGFSRPMLISLRNTFRHKGRLALTLLTLTLAGAIFIATFNVQVALTNYIDNISNYFLADVNLSLDRPYRISEIEGSLAEIPGIAQVEGWAQARGEMVLPDGSAGESVNILAPPASSRLVKPIMLSGRWIMPEDHNAVVLNERFRSRFPELIEGDRLRLKIYGKETDWTVVGFYQLAGKSSGFLAYTSYDVLSRVINQPAKASGYRIVASTPNLSLAEQKQLGREIEAHLQAAGYRVADITAGAHLHEISSGGLSVLTIFLLVMASLTAVVGSIGLTGTMSINVLERTREIGVMRAIGASNSIITRMVMVEGVLIGLISWGIGTLLAFPISNVMSDTISRALFDAPSNFAFTANGFIIWLVVVLLLSVLASVGPARNAAKLTIREVLAYE